MINRILSLAIATLCVYHAAGALRGQMEVPVPEVKVSVKQASVSDQQPAMSQTEGTTPQQVNGKMPEVSTRVNPPKQTPRIQLTETKIAVAKPVKPKEKKKVSWL